MSHQLVSTELAQYEAIIERGLKTFIEVGEALLQIRDKKLYEDGTFEAYCLRRWGLSRPRAYELMAASQVVRDVSAIADTVPANEAQARPLAKIKTPEARQQVWKATVKEAEAENKPVTAERVERMVNDFFASDAPAPAPEPEAEPLTLTVPAEIVKPATVAKFNRTNDNVEWALWTWNPVTGCLHNCAYCYARDIANRFFPQKFEPTFHADRVHAPRYMKVPEAAADNIGEKNVFVCSMADLWGKWVPSEWIDAILEEVRNAPQWNFLFLTKFPARYEEYAGKLPANAWIGTSVDNQNAVARAEKAFKKVKAAGYEGIAWLSCEPMMERLTFSSLSMFDWVVVGGASRSTQTPEFFPPFEWIHHLYDQARSANCKFYMKTNLFGDQYTGRIREYPVELPSRALTVPAPVSALSKFCPPSLEEVTEYMGEIGVAHMAQRWHDYYSANGWKVGKNPMKDWKASCRMWRDKDTTAPGAALSGKLPADRRQWGLEEHKTELRGWFSHDNK